MSFAACCRDTLTTALGFVCLWYVSLGRLTQSRSREVRPFVLNCTEGDTKTQRGSTTYPKLLSEKAVELALQPWLPVLVCPAGPEPMLAPITESFPAKAGDGPWV